ncbi:reverse transcriptase domain-containing protein [Tanacetum coccineum]
MDKSRRGSVPGDEEVANEAVRAVLLTERDERQMPIHYVSRSFQGAETNYALMEKLALTLVYAARRLRRYFQAHPIKAVELGAYDITYVPRVAVKGQVLADFLADTSTKINVTPERLYTDGASNNGGSGAGLILIAPDDVEYSYALRLNFSNSNNDAEYEALLAGLRIATEMKVKDIYAFVDSKLVASQVEGSYEAKAENMKADALSKLAVVQFDHLSKEVLVEKGILPEDPVDARTLMEKIRNYTMEDGVLYRKSYLVPLMRPRQVVAKAMNLGYYWPSMHRDARELIRACDDCQTHASVPRLPKADMILVTSAWSFMKWGIDIVGPLPEGPGRVKYLIVATDYFTKWIEAKPLASITGKQVVNFTCDNIGNEAVERANRSLLRGIKTRLEKGGLAWAEEVPNVLWAHRIIKKTSNGETPFSLTYGASPKLRPDGGAKRNSRYKGGQVQATGREVLQQKDAIVLRNNEASRAANTCKLGPTWEGPYKSHKEANGLWDFKFPCLDQLELVYGRDRATSATAEGYMDAIHNMEVEQNVESGENFGDYFVSLTHDENDMQNTSQVNPTTSNINNARTNVWKLEGGPVE